MLHDEIKLRNLFLGYYKEKTSSNKAMYGEGLLFQRSQEKDFGAAEGVVESGATDEGGAGG